MDDRHLGYFIAVAERLGFAAAARDVAAAQSTVSAGIRSLESELGVTLFDRSPHRVALTPSGEELLPRARAALRALDDLRAAARDEPEVRGRLRLGTFTNLPTFDLPSVLADFRRAYPAVDLVLGPSPTGSSGFVDDVRRGRVDVAFFGLGVATPGLVRTLLATSAYVALLAPDHPLATTRRVALAELARHPFVDAVAGFGTRRTLDAALLERGIAREIAVEVGDLGEIPQFVAAGHGVAALPASTVVAVPGLAVVPLVERIDWRLELLSRPDAGPAAQALIAAISAAALVER